ncbi:MAG: redoxin family protein [Chthonomonas sp.]|nr:redoxin family protein [Chthonomonas sp.]
MKWSIWVALLLVGCAKPLTNPAAPFKGKEPISLLHYSLLDSLRQGPVLVLFLPRDCVGSAEVKPFVNLVSKGYKDRLQVLALYAGTDLQTAEWIKAQRPDFVTIPDWDATFTKRYSLTAGPAAALVDRDSNIIKQWPSLARTQWLEINTEIARLLKSEPAKIDLNSAPEQPPTPCAYP